MKSSFLVLFLVVCAFLLGVFIQSVLGPKPPRLISVSAEEFKEEMEQKNAVILDIRTPEEYNQGRIAGAVNIDYYKDDFRAKLNKLDKDKPYKIYCNSGNRSSKTMVLMQEMGFTNVTELSGGIQAWASNNFSTCVNC